MQQICIPANKKCATCEHFAGPRTLGPNERDVRYDSKAEGLCIL